MKKPIRESGEMCLNWQATFAEIEVSTISKQRQIHSFAV